MGPHARVGAASRDYEGLVRAVGALPRSMPRAEAMAKVVDLAWDAVRDAGVSWLGIYLKQAGADAMVLGPRHPKPACSPIGLQGCCGRSWREHRPLVVRDVRMLGGGYIACDPRDLSEVVVPLFEDDGTCWGVLDVDSFDEGSFDRRDAEWLARVVETAGLSAPGHAGPILEV